MRKNGGKGKFYVFNQTLPAKINAKDIRLIMTNYTIV